MSSRPKRCAAWRTKAAASASRSTCASTNRASPPLATISAATRLPRSASRSANTTLAPSITNRRTVASPMPEAPPVTAVTFPSSRVMPLTSGPNICEKAAWRRNFPMAIIDSQIHAYEANTPKRPWHSVPNWPAHVTGDEMVAAMDRVCVDGSIFTSAFSMYRYDASYAVEVQRAHPGRFALVKPVDPDDPAVADVIADWKKTPGTVGIRIMMTKEAGRAPD